jgi:hypothetical protein
MIGFHSGWRIAENYLADNNINVLHRVDSPATSSFRDILCQPTTGECSERVKRTNNDPSRAVCMTFHVAQRICMINTAKSKDDYHIPLFPLA